MWSCAPQTLADPGTLMWLQGLKLPGQSYPLSCLAPTEGAERSLQQRAVGSARTTCLQSTGLGSVHTKKIKMAH